MKERILLLVIIFSSLLAAQTDWQKWEAKQINYQLPTSEKHEYALDNSSIVSLSLTTLRNVYYFFISDLDGDNCPFSPSCSQFFIEAVKETNLITGTMMFADRFTRDLNPVKVFNDYELLPNRKFFDPPYKYTLNLDKKN